MRASIKRHRKSPTAPELAGTAASFEALQSMSLALHDAIARRHIARQQNLRLHHWWKASSFAPCVLDQVQYRVQLDCTDPMQLHVSRSIHRGSFIFQTYASSAPLNPPATSCTPPHPLKSFAISLKGIVGNLVLITYARASGAISQLQRRMRNCMRTFREFGHAYMREQSACSSLIALKRKMQ